MPKAHRTLFTQPQPGDIAFYNFGSGHAGIVESVNGSVITTIEGRQYRDSQPGQRR